MRLIGFSILMICFNFTLQAQELINSSAVPAFTTAGQGDLYIDENDVYYIGLRDGSLKELGVVTARGTNEGDVLTWDSIGGQWQAETIPQILVAARRTTAYTPPTGTTFNTLVYNTALTNVGSSYNTTSGVFTAPETGLYEVQIHNVYQGGTNGDNKVQVRVLSNGSVDLLLGASSSPYSAGNNIRTTLTGNSVVTLQAGQTIIIEVGGRLNNFVPQVGAGQHSLKIIRLR